MKDRTFILISVPDDFLEKFSGLIKNVNILNKNSSKPQIDIHEVYKKDYAAVPIKKGLNGNNKNDKSKG